MANEFFTILTATGKAKLAAAQTSGTPLQITQMAVGDGDNGAYYNPVESQTALKHETWRGALNNLSVDASNPNWIVAELVIPDTVGGFYIREVGLFDSTGALIAVGKFPESYKPTLAAGSNKQLYVRMILEVSNASAVTLLVDPSVVLATRATVDQRIAEELAKLDGKPSVKVATTAAIALTGLQTIDGVALAAGDRVLVKDQAAAKDNGIYVAAAGAWARAADADASIEVTPGLFVGVEQGTANADSIWQLITDGQITLGTTGLAFEMFAGKTGVVAGTYRNVTVNQRGQVVGGTNPTTVSGYGITDAVTRIASGQPLPAQNIGPIWHDDYNCLLTWQVFNANGANYTGYASVLVGSLLLDTQSTPRTGYVKSGVQNLSKTAYAALRAWAMHNGILVAVGTWQAGQIVCADNADGTTFRVYDVRGEFLRAWDDGRGTDSNRVFGSWQKGSLVLTETSVSTSTDAMANLMIYGGVSDVSAKATLGVDSYNAADYAGLSYVKGTGPYSTAAIPGTGGDTVTTGSSRPRNTALLASIKF